MEHPQFKNIDWAKLTKKDMKSPFIPPAEDNFDAEYTNDEWKDAEDPGR